MPRLPDLIADFIYAHLGTPASVVGSDTENWQRSHLDEPPIFEKRPEPLGGSEATDHDKNPERTPITLTNVQPKPI